MERTDDPFHEFYNADGDLIAQTNWNDSDQFSKHMSTFSTLDQQSLLNDLSSLQMRLNDPENMIIFNDMTSRAVEMGWSPDILYLMKASGSQNKIGSAIGILTKAISFSTWKLSPRVVKPFFEYLTEMPIGRTVNGYIEGYQESLQRGQDMRSKNNNIWKETKSQTNSFIWRLNNMYH